MTIDEATDLVLTCTATGHSCLPLWQYLPGMQVTMPIDLTGFPYPLRGRVCKVSPIDLPLSGHTVDMLQLSVENDDGDCIGMQRDATLVRPDFTDDLTVQALWLLVRRAYFAGGKSLSLNYYATDIRSVVVTHGEGGPIDYGEPAIVFARLLAKAPRKA